MKGSWYVCVSSVISWVFSAEHWSTFTLFFQDWDCITKPHVCLLRSKLIAVVVIGFMIMMIYVCQGLTRDKLCTFFATKELKDVLWWALACAASRQMPSGQAPATLLQCLWIFWSLHTRQLNYINVVRIKRNNKVKQKAKRQPGAVAKSKGTAGEKSVVGEQLGRADLWAIYHERNKDRQSEIWDIKKPERGFGWWHLMGVWSQSQAFLQSTKARQLTGGLSQRLPKALLQQEAPAPRKLQRRLLIFILQVCSVFTHIRLLFLGNLLPPPLFPTHRGWHKPCAERTLPSGQPWAQGQRSPWPARLCRCTPTQRCRSICWWQLLQIRGMVMEMKNGIDDFLVDTLCYPSWALLQDTNDTYYLWSTNKMFNQPKLRRLFFWNS